MLQHIHNQLNAEILFDVVHTIADDPTEQTFAEQISRLTELEIQYLRALMKMSPADREEWIMRGEDDE